MTCSFFNDSIESYKDTFSRAISWKTMCLRQRKLMANERAPSITLWYAGVMW